jgi:hypothetical protein
LDRIVTARTGDAPSLALETVFNQPLELETILIRSRSLIVIDWGANRKSIRPSGRARPQHL